MPVCMGILCERCRTVYFISQSGTSTHKSTHIYFDRLRKDFRMACDPPCNTVTYFHKAMLKPYSVSAYVLKRGYANIIECEPVVQFCSDLLLNPE
jgi:hypothetical protein